MANRAFSQSTAKSEQGPHTVAGLQMGQVTVVCEAQ